MSKHAAVVLGEFGEAEVAMKAETVTNGLPYPYVRISVNPCIYVIGHADNLSA
jgi:hypothetical protein